MFIFYLCCILLFIKEPKLKIMKEMPVPKKDEDMKKWISDLREKRYVLTELKSTKLEQMKATFQFQSHKYSFVLKSPSDL